MFHVTTTGLMTARQLTRIFSATNNTTSFEIYASYFSQTTGFTSPKTDTTCKVVIVLRDVKAKL